jgi:hypothetical protein
MVKLNSILCEKSEEQMVIIYSAKHGEEDERLLQTVVTVVLEKDITICRTVDALSRALRRPWSCAEIVILLTSGTKEILDILSVKDLLWDMKIILILPDSSPDTVAKGHLLRPRFMSDCQGNFQDVAAVLKRMMENRISTKISLGCPGKSSLP